MVSSATSAARSRRPPAPGTEPRGGRRALSQALVESALVLPVVIVCCLGALQVVLYAHAHDVLQSAALEGARLAAEDGRGPDDGVQRAGALVAAGLGSSVQAVQLVPTADADLVTLEIDAELRPLLPLPGLDSLPLRAISRVARERFRPAGGLR